MKAAKISLKNRAKKIESQINNIHKAIGDKQDLIRDLQKQIESLEQDYDLAKEARESLMSQACCGFGDEKWVGYSQDLSQINISLTDDFDFNTAKEIADHIYKLLK